MLYTIVTPPAAEPVPVADLKAHLNILHDTEDALIAAFGQVALEHIETTTGRALVSRTIDAWFPAWPARGVIELPQPPLVSVTAVYYLDSAGAEQTLASDLYDVVAEGLIGRIERRDGASWPALAASSKAVRVRYVAGYGADGAGVPHALRAAVKLLTEHFYYRRGATSETRADAVPMSVDALCSPYKTFGWV